MNASRAPISVPAWRAFVIAALILLAAAVKADVASAEPELTEALPGDGQMLQEPPETFHLCFSEAVKIEDPADFQFVLKVPDNRQPGTRTVFQTDGLCVDIMPGPLENVPAGIWTLDWSVRSQADGSEGAGTIRLQVGGDFGLTPAAASNSATGTDADDGDSPWIIVAIALGAVAGIGITAAAVALLRRSTPA